MALSGGAAMSAIAPLMGVDQTSIRPVEIDANDPEPTLTAMANAGGLWAGFKFRVAGFAQGPAIHIMTSAAPQPVTAATVSPKMKTRSILSPQIRSDRRDDLFPIKREHP